MQDIADASGLGVATVFRYFPKKEKVIVAVASDIVASHNEIFASILQSNGSGIDKLSRVFDMLNFFSDELQRKNSKLIEAFEVYIATSIPPPDNIGMYRSAYLELAELLRQIGEIGVQDGTIRSDIDVADTLLTLMSAFGHFSKKTAMIHGIEALQVFVEESKQFEIMKTVFLDYLEPKN